MPFIARQASRAGGLLREHRHVLIIGALLTLILTYPTIVYVFRTDVFWHPAGESHDVHIKLWDIWYGGRILTGQAEPFFTDLLFYPEGLSLNRHPLFIPHIILVNALRAFLPIWNAFSLAWLVIIATTAFSAYTYLLWLFQHKWIALFGAVVFGFSPHALSHANHPDIAFIAPIPLILYGFHRGIIERRLAWVGLAGALAGLTTAVSFYQFVCVLITLGLFVCAFAVSRWRQRQFWLAVALLGLAIALSSFWRLHPLLTDSDSIDAISNWHLEAEIRSDAISFLVNHLHPVASRLFAAPWQSSGDGEVRHISFSSFLGYLPLLLVFLGLASSPRRKTLPWLLLCALFLVLRLGSTLTVNGVVYPDIRLPKFYLDQILPAVFEAFWEVDIFMAGALMPFAVLTCYGLAALRERWPAASKPRVILALVAIVAFEYYIPVETERVFPRGDGRITAERLAFLGWLASEDQDDLRLIYLPFGRQNSKLYNIYQIMTGYPTAEGAISRTPDSAFDYIRSNHILAAWESQRPVHCDIIDQDAYLEALRQLEIDGFSHVVYHPRYENWHKIRASFRDIRPAYADDYVSVYRLGDLRASCPAELSASHRFTKAYANILRSPAVMDARAGVAVVFPPSPVANERFLRYLRDFAWMARTIVTVAYDERMNVAMQSSHWWDANEAFPLESQAALWLVSDSHEFPAERSEAFHDWFLTRYRYCARVHEDENASIDLYLRSDVPCAAMAESSALDVQYDAGPRLSNASLSLDSGAIRVYLSFENETEDEYGFSLQFFDGDGQKALQYDSVIYRDLLGAHTIDAAPLREGAYTVKLIVYDAETKASQGGRMIETGERVARELELARIEI